MSSIKQRIGVGFGVLLVCLLVLQLLSGPQIWRYGPFQRIPRPYPQQSSPQPRSQVNKSLQHRISHSREVIKYETVQNSKEGGGSGDTAGSKRESTTEKLSLIPQFSAHPNDLIADNYTLVIQSYKRNKLLKTCLKHYCGAPRVDQILVVWNNVGEDVPKYLRLYPCSVKITFIIQVNNTIRNRFKPFPQLRTEGVLSLDDDRLISYDDINFGFDTWKMFKHLLVGWEARQFTRELTKDGKSNFQYFPGGVSSNHYSLVLTGEAFLHVGYLELFSAPRNEPMHRMIDSVQNCEDLSMNVIISEHLRYVGHTMPSGVYVKLIHNVNVLENRRGDEFQGLWRRKNNFATRNDCLLQLEQMYGLLPIESQVLVSRLK